MQATRFGLLARGITLFAFSFASCADRDDAVDDPSGGAGDPSCSACAGEASEGGSGGSSASDGGTQSVQPTAGTGGSNGGAQSVQPTAGTGGSSAGAGNTLGGEGGGPADGLEELSLCDRLTQVSLKNLQTTKMFERAVYTDCRIDWLGHLYVDISKRDDYMNDLLAWNQKFWGCQEVPVGDFRLVWGTPALSQGDAKLVLDYYVAAAIQHLELTPKEEQEMREALERLSRPVITSSSLEPSQPSCVDPNGGAGQGGSGGAGGSTSLGGSP